MAKQGRNQGRYKITEEELLDEIRRLDKELNRPPTTGEIEDIGKYSYTTYMSSFDSWHDAVEAAGLNPDEIPPVGGASEEIPTDELIESLKDMYHRIGKPPTMTDVRREGKYSPTTYKKRFGSWEEVLTAAGIDRDAWLTEQSEKHQVKIISELQRLADELGRSPSPADVEEEGTISTSGVKMVFGTWDSALKEANLSTDYTPEPRTETDKEYLAEIQRLADELGRTPTTKEMSAYGDVSPNVFRRRFGTWNAAVRAAGLKPNVKQRITEEDYIEEVKRVAEEIGHPPTSTEMKEHGEYSAVTGTKLFGRWKNVIEAAGFTPDDMNKKGGNQTRVTKQELIDELQDVAEKVEGKPTTAEVAEHGSHSYGTYASRFGTWENALEAASIDVENKTDSSSESVDDETLIEELQRLSEQLNRPPRTKEMDEKGEYRSSLYRSRFGSWRDALDAAGFDDETIQNAITGRIPTDMLIEELNRVADELGHTPSITEMRHHGNYSVSPYQTRFGSWKKAIEKAELND